MGNINLGSKIIGRGQPSFIIAEAGVNHNGDTGLAKELIDVAAEAGADAVKFQTFQAEYLNLPTAPKSTYHIETTGNEESWFDLLRSQEISMEMHKELIEHCNKKNIMFLSTPYHKVSAEILYELDLPLIKVASTDTNNLPYLKWLAKKGKPLIISTGMCNWEEVKAAVKTILDAGNDQLAVLHCTSNYPFPVEQCNLNVLKTFQDEFDLPIGYSDHSLSETIPAAATALGACIYEKHYTMDRKLPGPDHRTSLEPEELIKMVKIIRETEAAMGTSTKDVQPCETENREKLRKSVVVVKPIEAGEALTEDNLDILRPGFGISPTKFEDLIGKTAKNKIEANQLLKEEDVNL